MFGTSIYARYIKNCTKRQKKKSVIFWNLPLWFLGIVRKYQLIECSEDIQTNWSPTTVSSNMLMFENLSCGICKVATWELGNVNERVFRGPSWLGELILLIYLLTPWCKVLLEKLTGSQVVKKFPTFYGTWRFITTFTSALHLYLSWASLIQPMAPPIQFTEVVFECYPSIYAWVFQVASFPQVSPPKILYATLLPSINATFPAPHILLDMITQIIFIIAPLLYGFYILFTHQQMHFNKNLEKLKFTLKYT